MAVDYIRPRFKPATFSRASTAYLDGVEYPANAPRYLSTGGMLLEEGTTNLLTANQASVETDTTGFSAWHGNNLRDATNAWHGSASLKTTCNTAGIFGPYLSSPLAVTAGQVYSAQVRARGSAARNVRIGIEWKDAGGGPLSANYSTYSVLPLSGWQQFVVTATAPTGAASAVIVVYTDAGGQVGDIIWTDGWGFEQKPYPTFWHLPGTSRARESLTVPNSGLSPAGGTLEVKVEINAMARRQAGQCPEIFNIPGGVQTQGILVFHSPTSAYWFLKTMADDGTVTQASFADSLLSDGIHVLRVDWTASQARLYVDTNPVPVATISSPKLPLAFGNVSLGGSWGTVMLNSGIYAVRLSDVPRGAEGLCDAGTPLAVDEHTLGLWLFQGSLLGERFGPLTIQVGHPRYRIDVGKPRYEIRAGHPRYHIIAGRD